MKELSSRLLHVFNIDVFKPKGKCFSDVTHNFQLLGRKQAMFILPLPRNFLKDWRMGECDGFM